MNKLEFFKPTWKKLIFFVIFLIAIYFLLYITKAPLFPCEKKATFPSGSEYVLGFCDVCSVSKYCINKDFETQTKIISKIIYFILIILIPYLLACYLIFKKFTSSEIPNQDFLNHNQP